jgi:DNA helicase-2/ATP-dependent DNA helicase PcrA
MDTEVQKYMLKESPRAPAGLQTAYAHALNAEQLDAVEHADGYSLVLAGAGSGKTRTLVYRVAWLIEHGVPPDRILLLTFTNKAAGEMLSRVSVLLKGEVKGMWGGTFHHVAHRILRHYASRIGYQNNFQILDQDDAVRLVKSILTSLHGGKAPHAMPKADALYRVLSYVRNSGQRLTDALANQFPHFLKHETILEGIAHAYAERKRSMQAMDFDDLLVYGVQLLATDAGARDALARRFQYVLVDEYQDTNHLQASFASLLSSHHHNLMVVGDDAQSIYSFRAADVANILAFPQDHPGAKVFRLQTNYRSRPEILHLANESIKKNAARYEKELKGIREHAQTLPVLAAAPDPEAQAAYLIEQVQARTDEGARLADMAVLFRASFQTLELELELAKREIPYIKRGGLRYFEQAHVKDVLSFLRIVANPRDELAWKRALTLYPGVGDQTAEGVWQRVKDTGEAWMKVFEEALEDRAFSSRAQQGLQAAQSDLAALAVRSDPGEMIEEVLTRRYREYAKELFEDAEDRILDLETLAAFAARYDSLQTLLADAALGEGFKGEVGRDHSEEDEDRLVLSTIHQAKGLEWKTVFVMGLTDGHFPNQRTLARPHEIEEERRLFYVAVTRAKDELFLTYPEISSLAGGMLLGRPSLFVRELPRRVYQRVAVDDGRGSSKHFEDIDIDDDGQHDNNKSSPGGVLGRVLGTFR